MNFRVNEETVPLTDGQRNEFRDDLRTELEKILQKLQTVAGAMPESTSGAKESNHDHDQAKKDIDTSAGRFHRGELQTAILALYVACDFLAYELHRFWRSTEIKASTNKDNAEQCSREALREAMRIINYILEVQIPKINV